jgi:hypothetical protein
MASMRNWLKGKEGRVVVVHCKAGKGRSGTASCSYLISEEGWEMEKALKRFTERRMRPNMGKGVSIPSQLRWIRYVDRWAKHGKVYVERQVEVLEVHCSGLRDGVKIQVEGFVDDGKKIKTFHTFTRSEREIVRGEIESSGGIVSVVSEVMNKNGIGRSQSKRENKSTPMVSDEESDEKPKHASTYPIRATASMDGATSSKEDQPLEGTGDVVFRPSKRVVLPTNDLNIDVERRNKAAFDLTYVTAVAHVWFNAFFEGNGPEQGGIADESGVFEITWDAMDGIKGSSRKGIPAFDKLAVVWRTLKPEGKPGIVITEPKEGEEVPQSTPADWHGEEHVEPSEGKDLGLRTSSPPDSSTNVSKASSIKSTKSNEDGNGKKPIITASSPQEDSTEGVRSHGPNGEEIIECPAHSNEGSEAGVDTPRHTCKSGLDRVEGIIDVCTGDLPGGKPEDQMQDAKETHLFHLGKSKATSS